MYVEENIFLLMWSETFLNKLANDPIRMSKIRIRNLKKKNESFC